MKSLWSATEASACKTDLDLRVYTSRLLGREPDLVLHGGGNTSVKSRQTNIFGEDEDIIFVKGSGWDLATIEPAGFSPCRMSTLLRMADLEDMSDSQMARELKACMTDPEAPMPSVEAILHAILPHKFVDHAHPDALLSIMNTPDGENRVREIYGNRVAVIPYVMPGFKLARVCATELPKQLNRKTVGVVLLNHGLFTFGSTAQESYERMTELITVAEEYLKANDAWQVNSDPSDSSEQSLRLEIASLRKAVSSAVGAPVIMTTHRDSECQAFLQQRNLAQISQQGPATPDHVIRTKRVPMLGRDVAEYVAAYKTYFEKHATASGGELTMLDPAPRVVLDRELGMCAIGRSAKAAAIVEEIYRHTTRIIGRAEKLGGWRALPAQDIFDVEYWELEQAKLRRAGATPAFAGEVALVTGAASGIGKACVDSLLERGAAVVGLDLQPGITGVKEQAAYHGIQCDLTDQDAVETGIERAVRRFGGIDMLVLNAGIFPKSASIAEMNDAVWRKVMAVNLDANLVMLRACHPLLKLAPNGGRVVVIGSKNVPAPGPGAAAYSASKAAVNQLARIAALEWGKDRIRINSLHPNMVFDTAIWTPEVLRTRAEHYGLTVDEYKTNNLLNIEITSHDVAELAAEMCGPLFGKTTGAQLPVDGGNERVI